MGTKKYIGGVNLLGVIRHVSVIKQIDFFHASVMHLVRIFLSIVSS